MVIWLIGMSGAGKTTIGREVYRQIKQDHPNTVYIDGDDVRYMLGGDLGHTIEDRRRNAARISHICEFLDRQHIHVVAAVLSIFHEWQDWNRQHFSRYLEVYLRVPLETLQARDPKGLYQQAAAGTLQNFVGVDIPFPPPKCPDLTIDNTAGLESVESVAAEIRRRSTL